MWVRGECTRGVRCCPSATGRSLVLLSFSPPKGSAVPLGAHCPCCGAHTVYGTPHWDTLSTHTPWAHRKALLTRTAAKPSFLLEDRMKRGLCETFQCFLFLLCCWMNTCFAFVLSFLWFHYQVFHSLQNTSNKQLIHLLKWQQYFICHFIFLSYFIYCSLLWKQFEG